MIRLGSFTVYNSGYPGHLEVDIRAANAPGRPLVWTSTMRAVDGDEVDVFVDTHGIAPGLYLIAINVRAFGTSRMSSQVVRGWLLLHYPTSPDCIAQLQG